MVYEGKMRIRMGPNIMQEPGNNINLISCTMIDLNRMLIGSDWSGVFVIVDLRNFVDIEIEMKSQWTNPFSIVGLLLGLMFLCCSCIFVGLLVAAFNCVITMYGGKRLTYEKDMYLVRDHHQHDRISYLRQPTMVSVLIKDPLIEPLRGKTLGKTKLEKERKRTETEFIEKQVYVEKIEVKKESPVMGRREEQEEDFNKCIICMENNRDIAIQCGHVFCSLCLDMLQKKECPTCRQPITTKIKVYL